MSIQNTSLKAYWEGRLGGSFSRQQLTVLDALNVWGVSSRADLVKHTLLPINVVCGRVNELLKRGVVEVSGKEIDADTGKEVQLLKLKEE